jgi:hypothetical protein
LSAMLVMVFSACQKDNEQAIKSSKNEKSGKDGYLAFGEDLKVLKDAFVPISGNLTFRKVLYQEVAKKFDGESNVLIKTLLTACKKEGFDLESALNQSFPANQTVQSLLDNMVRKGTKRHPHLYIPNFENVVSNDLKGSSSLNTRGSRFPVLVSRPNNESMLTLTGSRLTNGISETVPNVNEAYAISNEVWVVSVNERVNALAYYNPNPSVNQTGGGTKPMTDDGTGSYCRNGDDGTRENLLAFKMNDILEPWFDGGPEMYILALDMGSLVSSQIPKKLTQEESEALVVGNGEGLFKKNWDRNHACDFNILYPDENCLQDRKNQKTEIVLRGSNGVAGSEDFPSKGPVYHSSWEESSGKYFHWSLVKDGGANVNNLKVVQYVMFESDASGVFEGNDDGLEIPLMLSKIPKVGQFLGDTKIKIALDDDHDLAGTVLIPRENSPNSCNRSVFYTTGNWEVWSGWCKF